MKKDPEIEIRAEEVQEVLGGVPHWIVRRGLALLALVVAILFAGSWLFTYPDILTTSMTLTTHTPPASTVARTSGKLSALFVHDQQNVKKGAVLAIIENPAVYEDILFLESELLRLSEAMAVDKTYEITRKDLKLGGLQNTYSSFLISLESYSNFIDLNYYPRKIELSLKLLDANKRNLINIQKQHGIVKKQYELERSSYNRTVRLHEQGFVSVEEKDNAESSLLQSEMAVQNAQSSLDNQRIQIAQLEDNLMDYQQQYLEKKSSVYSGLKTIIQQLSNEIRSWKMTYLLVASIDGKVAFTEIWSVNQNVVSGNSVFTIVPHGQTQLIGKAQLPIARSGKVKEGQEVNVHFTNYPDNEYGMVIGKVKRVSLIPTKEGNYVVEVGFPNGLVTTYGKTLPLTQEMTANADIITEDMRLLERLVQPLKKIIKNNMN
jgi:HlyD family secretion protein